MPRIFYSFIKLIAMSKTIQLKIDEPCHENWQNMTPNDQGRHCMACQKTVVDFSSMSDKEILAYISKATNSICGRLDDHQMNRDMAEQGKKRRFSFIYMWNIVVATFLMTGTAKAQGLISTRLKGKVAVKCTPPPVMMGDTIIVEVPAKKTSVTGIVFDSETQLPLGSASVKIKGTEQGLPTDAEGNFRFNNIDVTKDVQFEVSAVGYEPQIFSGNNFGLSKDIKIFLKRKPEELDPVVVVGFGSKSCTYISGAMGIFYKDTTIEKVKKIIADWIPTPFKNNDVKVSPNPQRPGNSINISLKLKETGDYKLELIDASGRVVHVQALQVTAKEQIATVPTNDAWSTGVYYVRVSGKNAKNIYQSKVLLQ